MIYILVLIAVLCIAALYFVAKLKNYVKNIDARMMEKEHARIVGKFFAESLAPPVKFKESARSDEPHPPATKPIAPREGTVANVSETPRHIKTGDTVRTTGSGTKLKVLRYNHENRTIEDRWICAPLYELGRDFSIKEKILIRCNPFEIGERVSLRHDSRICLTVKAFDLENNHSFCRSADPAEDDAWISNLLLTRADQKPIVLKYTDLYAYVDAKIVRINQDMASKGYVDARVAEVADRSTSKQAFNELRAELMKNSIAPEIPETNAERSTAPYIKNPGFDGRTPMIVFVGESRTKAPTKKQAAGELLRRRKPTVKKKA